MSYVNSLCDIYQKINFFSNSLRYPYLGLNNSSPLDDLNILKDYHLKTTKWVHQHEIHNTAEPITSLRTS